MLSFFVARTAAAFACLFSAAPAVASTWSQDWTQTGRLHVGPHAQTARFAAGDGGHMLVANDRARLTLFDAAGAKRWTTTGSASTLVGRFQPGYGDAIVDADGSAWFSTRSVTGASFDEDSTLTRIDATGNVLWSRFVPGSQLARTAAGVVVAGCVRSGRGTVATHYDAAGQLGWQRLLPVPECERVRLASAGGSVYAAQFARADAPGRYTLSRIDAAGRIAQTVELTLPAAQVARVLATDAAVYLASDSASVHAFDAQTLAPRWNASDCRAHDVVPASAPSGAGDVICSRAGTLVRLDAATGTQRWAVPTASALHAVRVIGDAVLAADGASVRRFALADGAAGWSTTLPANSSADAAIGVARAANGRIGVAHSTCAHAALGCTALVASVALDNGALAHSAPIVDAPLDAYGDMLRDGDSIYSTHNVIGGSHDGVDIEKRSVVDGFDRWFTGHSTPYGARLTYSRHALGPNFVAVVAMWTMAPEDESVNALTGADVAVFGRDGVFRWRKNIDAVIAVATLQPEIVVDSAGDIVVGTAYVALGDDGYVRSSVLRRLIVATDEERWRVDAGAGYAPRLYRAGTDIIAVDDGFPDRIASVSRIATANGSLVWRAPVPTQLGLDVAVLADGDVAVHSTAGATLPAVSRLDYATGGVEWQRTYGDGATLYNMHNLQQITGGQLLVSGYTYPAAPLRANRPLFVRLDLATGNVVATSPVAIGSGASVTFTGPWASADGRLWVEERRAYDNESRSRGAWLTEVDVNGARLGSQALRLVPYSDVQRQTGAAFAAAPEAGRLLVHGTSVGGGKGDGHAFEMIDTSVTETGDLAVELDSVPTLRRGLLVPYAATVRYTGSATTTATLYLQLPWSSAGAPPTCVTPLGICTVDAASGGITVSLSLAPGDVARVSGTFIAWEPDGAFGGTARRSGDPLFAATVAGRTGLRESTLDNNFATQRPAMSLFADGFD